MNSNDFVSIDHILAEVISTLDDEDFRKGFSQGWYVSRIQDALQELAFDTFFDEVTLDFDMPENLRLEMPKGVFNIREIHGYNGDCCSPATSNVIHWKRNYNNKGGGANYTARVKEIGENSFFDPFLPNEGYTRQSYYGGIKLFANIQNGIVMFSSDCSSFQKIRITFNGMAGEIGDAPIIPRFFERAINAYVEWRHYKAMVSRDPRTYRALANDARAELYDMRDGCWKVARMRITSMDSWEKESMNEYISAIVHK